MENLHYLQKIEKSQLTVADVTAIYKTTGFDLTIPEQYKQFKQTAAAIVKLKETPNYMSILQVNNMAEILDNNSCLTITNVKKFLGNKYIQAILGIAITDLCGMFNINKNMTPEQIAFTVDTIINEYPLNQLTLADVKLCFKNIYFGRYGKIYDRLDTNIILDAMQQYFEERIEAAENKSYYEHLNNKTETR